MTDWASANLAHRAARDALNEAKRQEQCRCHLCGETDCGSTLCETKRRKAEQQAQLAVLAARHLGIGL